MDQKMDYGTAALDPASDNTLTAEQKAALVQSVARGRAQFAAGEAITGEEVSRWLRSWGTENELAPPTRKTRRA
jgi:predicted transcriptional regulator